MNICKDATFVKPIKLSHVEVKLDRNGNVKNVLYKDDEWFRTTTQGRVMQFNQVRGRGGHGEAIEYEYKQHGQVVRLVIKKTQDEHEVIMMKELHKKQVSCDTIPARLLAVFQPSVLLKPLKAELSVGIEIVFGEKTVN